MHSFVSILMIIFTKKKDIIQSNNIHGASNEDAKGLTCIDGFGHVTWK